MPGSGAFMEHHDILFKNVRGSAFIREQASDFGGLVLVNTEGEISLAESGDAACSEV